MFGRATIKLGIGPHSSVSHVRVSETKHCFGFVLELFCVVLFQL